MVSIVTEHPNGYISGYGYVGFVNGKKMLFATDKEYRDFLNSKKEINIHEKP